VRACEESAVEKVSGAASPLSIRAKKQFHLLSMSFRRGSVGGRKEATMYTGKLIEELMEKVEVAEKRFWEERSREEKLAHFYAISQFELAQFEPTLAGVA
jgi:hypothetical protein